MAYVTMECNDDAVDFILRSDSCEAGDPPRRLIVKPARPRDLPRQNYPPENAFLLVDAHQTREHGAAHGMTDMQVATIVETLKGLQKSAFQTTVERRTGSVTNLHVGFQQAFHKRLGAIEAAVNESV